MSLWSCFVFIIIALDIVVVITVILVVVSQDGGEAALIYKGLTEGGAQMVLAQFMIASPAARRFIPKTLLDFGGRGLKKADCPLTHIYRVCPWSRSTRTLAAEMIHCPVIGSLISKLVVIWKLQLFKGVFVHLAYHMIGCFTEKIRNPANRFNHFSLIFSGV